MKKQLFLSLLFVLWLVSPLWAQTATYTLSPTPTPQVTSTFTTTQTNTMTPAMTSSEKNNGVTLLFLNAVKPF